VIARAWLLLVGAVATNVIGKPPVSRPDPKDRGKRV